MMPALRQFGPTTLIFCAWGALISGCAGMIAIDYETRIGHRCIRKRVRPNDAAAVRALEPQLHPAIDRRDNEKPTIVHELGVCTSDFPWASADTTRHKMRSRPHPGPVRCDHGEEVTPVGRNAE